MEGAWVPESPGADESFINQDYSPQAVKWALSMEHTTIALIH